MRPKNLEYLNVNMADVDTFGPAVAIALSYVRYRKEKVANWYPSRKFFMDDIGMTQRQADKSLHIWRALNGDHTEQKPSWMSESLVQKLTDICSEVNNHAGSEVNQHPVKNLTESCSEVNRDLLRNAPTKRINKELTINKANADFSFPISFPPLWPGDKIMAQRRADFFQYLYSQDKPYFFLPHVKEIPEVSKLVWDALNLSSMPDHEERECLRMAISVMDTNPIGSTFPEVLVNALSVTLANVCDRYDASWDDLTKSRQHNMREVQQKLNDLLNTHANVDLLDFPA